jgi:integrase
MTFHVSITKQNRRRTLASGQTMIQPRWFVNHRDPKTGERKLPSFERLKDAEAFRNQLLASVEAGTYGAHRESPSVAEAVEHWLGVKRGQVRPRTLEGYVYGAKLIVGPLLSDTARQRPRHTMSGSKAKATAVPLLGDIRLSQLTTADIRAWYMTLQAEISTYAANRAKMFLASVLALAEEDYGVRTPRMPTVLGRGRHKTRKTILTPEQVRVVLDAAREDKRQGIYYAFPFLVGTRPSEQLGLLWDDVDFDADVIRIRRTQENDGAIVDLAKTEAGVRDVPLCPMLREMLLEWRLACPRLDGELYRVFPGPGRLGPWPTRRQGGGALRYQNFRNRIWVPALTRLELPYVTPHSARHSFVSTLQAQGVEVGLVAKLAGHANPNVTLGHYTQAVRGGEGAMAALESAYSA